MKKQAIIYTRVSTEEQADKGYSLKDQEDRLRKYCELKDIEVVIHFQEDHSAKTFDRPEFHKLIAFAKKNKENIDLLLFMKWDRFSRNAGDSYYMINLFRKLNIECQAIEQPLDLQVPENKMMLAFYLAAPEVENDRRSLNTIGGMRRAMKEGRWMAMAPVGYKNSRDERGGALIIPTLHAELVKAAFTEMAKGIYTMEEVRRKLNYRGLKCGKNNFPLMLKNPVYIGQLYIPAFRDEPEQIVQGIHEAIIDERTFYAVQDVMKGRKKQFYITRLRDEFPLRGFLYCKRCGKKLTASGSFGNGGRYYYYHCMKGCNERFRADIANEVFVNQLESIRADEEQIEYYNRVIADVFISKNIGQSTRVKKIKEEINTNMDRLKSAQQLLLDGGLELLEYKGIKKRYEDSNAGLTRELSSTETADNNFLKYLKYDVGLIKGIDQYYVCSSITTKQRVTGAFFPNRLIYDNEGVRTSKLNEVVSLLCPSGAGFLEKKIGLEAENCLQPNVAPPPGLEPGTP